MKEPEEIIEELMVEVLSNALPDIDTIGALSPVPEGEQKKSADTYIAVFVDFEEPLNAYKSPLMPCTYSLRITVHYANADDATGAEFRDTCRAVRNVITSFCGDKCVNMNGNGFECDDFGLTNTQTALDQDADIGGIAKTYTVSLTGRITNKEN